MFVYHRKVVVPQLIPDILFHIKVERPCKDAIPNCGSYGTYICFDINQYQWVDKNCRKFCGFCGKQLFFI